MAKRTTKQNLSALTILDVMGHSQLLRKWFKGESWRAWRVFLSALFGLPVVGADLDLFRQHTGRQTPSREQAREAWLVVGRRGGKSRIAALCATFLGCFRSYREVLAPGERGTVMVIAADRRQARVIFRYVCGLVDGVPFLARMVESRTRESISLNNGIDIEIHTSNFRAVRGYCVVSALADEVAYWRDEESANPDVEILNGLRPGMATVPGALLLGISSPYSRRGALWQAFKTHYGQDEDPVLVWKGTTLEMNPSVDEKVIAQAYETDSVAARAEYGAEFRSDLETFTSQEAIDAVTIPGRRELPAVPGVLYHGFNDPSGGSQDSMTVAVAHNENGKAVLDAVREVRPPFSPDQVTKEFADLLKGYGVHSVRGDRYAGLWPREKFQEYGIAYEVSEKTKSELYLELLPALNSKRVELLDHKRLLAQLGNLERRTSRGGRDMVDHSPGSHDDLVNSACGTILLALQGGDSEFRSFDRPPEDDPFVQLGDSGGGREPHLSEQLDRLQDRGGGRGRDDPFGAW